MEQGAPSSSAIPMDHTPLKPLSGSRRQSLPSNSNRSTSVPSRRFSNQVYVQPASPEVISSLISSLSAISTPAQTHFDSLPHIGSRTAPTSPNALPPDLSQQDLSRGPVDPSRPSTGPGFGVDYGAYRSAETDAEATFLHPDDAAISPIVRMAKAPVPSSPRSPRYKGDSSPGRPSSRDSYASSWIDHEDSSYGFGVISTEPGPRQSTASIASSGSGRKKGVKDMLKRASQEFKIQGNERIGRKTSFGDGQPSSFSRSKTSLRSKTSMSDLTEEDGHKGAKDSAKDETASLNTPDTNFSSTVSNDSPHPSPGGIGSGKLIPTRESSLRHSYGGTSRKRRSSRHRGSRDLRDAASVKSQEDQVSKRIQELKEQQKKIKDELLNEDDRPAKDGPTASPRVPYRRSATEPPMSTRGSRAGTGDEPLTKVDELSAGEAEESAPSPTVMTGRSSKSMKRNSGPLASMTSNAQSAAGKPSSEKGDQLDHSRSKRRSRPSSTHSTENRHRRSPSGGLLAGGPVQRPKEDERPSSADSIDNAVEAYVTSNRLTRRIPHPTTGRMVAFSEVGDPKGHVIICCVGMGLTRFLTAFYDELAWTLKLRLITPDRPGVGESEPCMDGSGTPLSWPDDVAIICNHLRITKFSMLAHSAGAIYALATALRMPQHIRGRIHLLAPWIPPSQMTGMGPHKEPLPANAVPYSQRLLRALPTTFLKVANSSFMSTTSASITSSLPKSPKRPKQRKSSGREGAAEPGANNGVPPRGNGEAAPQGAGDRTSQDLVSRITSDPTNPNAESAIVAAAAAAAAEDRERQSDYDNRLTHAIWRLATTNANPAVDLLVCLERRQTIGFRYVDINRAVVIHHGSRDTRVPVDNVRWLGKTMRRCEVRVLEGEGHGLMASAAVMSNVLMEISKEWEDWTTVVQGRRQRALTVTR